MRLVTRHLASVESTNSWARAHAASLDRDAITMITADAQTAGRGRHGRTWVSTGDDITATFAFLLPPAAMPGAYQLSPLLAVAARRALARHGVTAGIKWPNDLVLGGSHKVAGILCEVEACGSPSPDFWAILGIGLNVNSTPDAIGVERPVWPLTTLRHFTGRAFDVPAVTADLAAAVQEVVPQWLAGALRGPTAGGDGAASDGWSRFQDEYLSASVLVGRRIAFHEGGKGARLEGVVETIGADGKLVVNVNATAAGSDGASGGGGGGGGGGASVTRREYLSGEVVGLYLTDDTMLHGHPDGKA